MKVCAYFPYPMKIWVNGHEWAKRQAVKAGIEFKALSNGFFSYPDPEGLQQICDSLGPGDIQRFAERWPARLPLPLDRAGRDAWYWWELSMRQIEVSRTIAFTAPRFARSFFDALILDISRARSYAERAGSVGEIQTSGWFVGGRAGRRPACCAAGLDFIHGQDGVVNARRCSPLAPPANERQEQAGDEDAHQETWRLESEAVAGPTRVGGEHQPIENDRETDQRHSDQVKPAAHACLLTPQRQTGVGCAPQPTEPRKSVPAQPSRS